MHCYFNKPSGHQVSDISLACQFPYVANMLKILSVWVLILIFLLVLEYFFSTGGVSPASDTCMYVCIRVYQLYLAMNIIDHPIMSKKKMKRGLLASIQCHSPPLEALAEASGLWFVDCDHTHGRGSMCD